jgi:hypothetical protein
MTALFVSFLLASTVLDDVAPIGGCGVDLVVLPHAQIIQIPHSVQEMALA